MHFGRDREFLEIQETTSVSKKNSLVFLKSFFLCSGHNHVFAVIEETYQEQLNVRSGQLKHFVVDVICCPTIDQSLLLLLRGPKPDSGSMIVSAEEMGTCKEEVTLQFCGRKLDKKDFFGKSDPFLLLYRTNEDGT